MVSDSNAIWILQYAESTKNWITVDLRMPLYTKSDCGIKLWKLQNKFFICESSSFQGSKTCWRLLDAFTNTLLKLYISSYLAIYRWLGLRNYSVYLYIGTIKSLISIPHISCADSALHVVTWLYIASNLKKVGSIHILHNDRINSNQVYKRGLDRCNYKFLDIWFWYI